VAAPISTYRAIDNSKQSEVGVPSSWLILLQSWYLNSQVGWIHSVFVCWWTRLH